MVFERRNSHFLLTPGETSFVPRYHSKLEHLEEEQRHLTDVIADRGALEGEIRKLKDLLEAFSMSDVRATR